MQQVIFSGDHLTHSILLELRTLVNARTQTEGRTDSLYSSLRYYRFNQPTQYHKKQILIPGIVVVLQGSKTAQIAGQSITYDENHFLVLGMETVCNGTVVNASEDYPYLAIHLDLPSNLIVKTLTTLESHAQSLSSSSAEQAFAVPIDINIMGALVRLIVATNTRLDCEMLAPLVMEEIIIRLLRSDATSNIRHLANISRTALRIQESMSYINSNLQRQLTVAELASIAAMSASHYAYSFRTTAGVTPMRYVREQRLDKARNLLAQNCLAINEIADKVGFDNPEHFSRLFKRRYAMTPGEFITKSKVI